MNAMPLSAHPAIGVMNFKRIMKFGFVIDAMLSSARLAMKWTNVKIVGKLSVQAVVLYVVVNSVDVGFVKNALPPVDGKIV